MLLDIKNKNKLRILTTLETEQLIAISANKQQKYVTEPIIKNILLILGISLTKKNIN